MNEVSREELEAKLLELIKEHSDVEVSKSDYSTPFADLGIDSVYAVEVANDMEDFLDIVIDDRDIAKFRSLDDTLAYFDGLK